MLHMCLHMFRSVSCDVAPVFLACCNWSPSWRNRLSSCCNRSEHVASVFIYVASGPCECFKIRSK
jgi:hypothetical protein